MGACHGNLGSKQHQQFQQAQIENLKRDGENKIRALQDKLREKEDVLQEKTAELTQQVFIQYFL